MNRDLLVSTIIIVSMFVLEGVYPLFRGRTKHLQHTGINVGFGIGNGLISKAFFGILTIQVVQWSSMSSTGIIRLVSMNHFTKGLFGFLLFDLWMYWWHRLNHEIHFLWRFHRMHHTDLEMDASTALRFHPGEKIFSDIIRLAVIPVLGLELLAFAIYRVVMSPIILFHHSNIALPEKFDRILRAVIVTPNMHRVHHSIIREETDSNYGSVFSFWDRILGTYKRRDDTDAIIYGLNTMRGTWWQSVAGMLLTPLYGIRKLNNRGG